MCVHTIENTGNGGLHLFAVDKLVCHYAWHGLVLRELIWKRWPLLVRATALRVVALQCQIRRGQKTRPRRQPANIPTSQR